MLYCEKKADLFDINNEYWFVHCISADFVMGKGIAVEFNKRFDMKNQIKKNFQKDIWNKTGYCLVVPNIKVFNLVTKEKYFHKPTYKTVQQSLEDMKKQILDKNVNKIAMPFIACGLDGLKWKKVSKIIFDTFYELNIEILVCSK